MSNALTVTAANLPAHLRERAALALAGNKDAAAGIKVMAFSKLGIKGGKWQLKLAGQAVQVLTDPNDSALPLRQFECVVVGWNKAVSKTFFLKKFSGAEGVEAEPDCTSEDGITPDDGVKAKQSTACAICPMNVWGSKTNEKGKKVKACDDGKVIVVLPTSMLEEFEPLQLKLSPMAMKNWKEYVEQLDGAGIPLNWCETVLRFDMTTEYPLVTFTFSRLLDEAELEISEARSDSEAVKKTATPRSFGTTAPAPAVPAAVAPPSPAGANPPAPAAPVQPEPAQPAPVATPKKGFGFTSPAPEGAGAAAPAASGKPRKPVAEKPVAPPPPTDPLAGVSEAVRAAIAEAGGLDSVPGRAIAGAFKIDLTGYAPQPAQAGPGTTQGPPATPVAPIGGKGQQGSLKDILNTALNAQKK